MYKLGEFNVDFEAKASNEDVLNAWQKYNQDYATQIEKYLCEIQLRRDYGSLGVKADAGKNYFKFQVAGLKLYIYFVEFQEEQKDKDIKEKKFKSKGPALKIKMQSITT